MRGRAQKRDNPSRQQVQLSPLWVAKIPLPPILFRQGFDTAPSRKTLERRDAAAEAAGFSKD